MDRINAALNALNLLNIDELKEVQEYMNALRRQRHIDAIHEAITAAIHDGYCVGIGTDEILNTTVLDNDNENEIEVVLK